jgi:CubicO group peptidase (beta-lactamase class C family)
MTTTSTICRLFLAIALFAANVVSQTNNPPKLSGGFKPPSNFAAKAAKYMQERARVMGFSGAVLVARGGQPVFRQSYGLANHEFSIPNTPRTKFRVGSVSKQFTSAAILLLEQRGKLKLTDPVSKHLPDWPRPWGEVTIHHLLSHTAGLPRLTTQALLDVSAFSRATPSPFQKLGDLFKDGEELQPLDFKPGENWAYSNVGYIMLSMIIEKVAGKSYCDFVSEEMFRPLNMTNTGCEDPSTLLMQRASGYTRINERLTNASYVDMRFAVGAGSIYSTPDDLLLWNSALDSSRLLNASEKEKLFTPVKNDYGYGWWIQNKSNHKVEWHGGNLSGFVAQITRYPSEQLFIVVLSNVWSGPDRSQVRAIANELSTIAFGESYELPRKHKETRIDPAIYDSYVGKYTRDGKPDDIFALVREGNRLLMQIPPGQTVFEIFPESETQFFAKWGEFYLTFVKDGQGKVTHILIRHEGEKSRRLKLS